MRYEGVVYVSGSTQAWATIDDVDVDEWRGSIREIRSLEPRSGLHTICIGDGERAGLVAVVDVLYDDAERAGTLIGRTPFGPSTSPHFGQ